MKLEDGYNFVLNKLLKQSQQNNDLQQPMAKSFVIPDIYNGKFYNTSNFRSKNGWISQN